MTGVSVLLLGVSLGLRHATDADHLIAISALIQREPGAPRAARIAALWGAGHTLAFFAVGLLVVLADLRVPPQFELGVELLVALMLIGLGAWHLFRIDRHEHDSASAGIAHARPVLVGVVHGLAGSAGIALLAATTTGSRIWAAAYLGFFGLGTVVGMVVLTVLLAWPLQWSMQRAGRLRHAAVIIAAVLSIALGIGLGADVILSLVSS